MPVIIQQQDGSTDPNEGVIRVQDLGKMKSDFINQVALTPLPPRNALTKRYSFYFTKQQILELFEAHSDNSNANAVEISIGVHLPNTVIDCGTPPVFYNHSHCVCAVVSMANRITREPINDPDKAILISDYKPANPFIEVGVCCPGTKPPPPES